MGKGKGMGMAGMGRGGRRGRGVTRARRRPGEGSWRERMGSKVSKGRGLKMVNVIVRRESNWMSRLKKKMQWMSGRSQKVIMNVKIKILKLFCKPIMF